MRELERTCFVQGTPLLTPEGSKAIEEFKRGDKILSRSELGPEHPLVAAVVEKVFVSVAPIMSLKASGREIRTTEEHPFWLMGFGWRCAKDLKVGDQLCSHDGQTVVVEGVTKLDEVATVYNLRISEYHTYFVGASEWGFSVWAHNTCYEIRRLANGQFGLFERATGNPVTLTRNGVTAEITGNSADAVRRAGLDIPQVRAAGITEGVVGEYTTTIRWGIQDVQARPSGPGYWGRRTPLANARANAYELKINPSGENFYLPDPAGGYVQFENLVGNTLQDAKFIGEGSSFNRRVRYRQGCNRLHEPDY